jgi:hypothetical protein
LGGGDVAVQLYWWQSNLVAIRGVGDAVAIDATLKLVDAREHCIQFLDTLITTRGDFQLQRCGTRRNKVEPMQSPNVGGVWGVFTTEE